MVKMEFQVSLRHLAGAYPLSLLPTTPADEMLATATQATLRKLKKAVLVEMCEARELDTEGTKEQLSQWLIEWVRRRRLVATLATFERLRQLSFYRETLALGRHRPHLLPGQKRP